MKFWDFGQIYQALHLTPCYLKFDLKQKEIDPEVKLLKEYLNTLFVELLRDKPNYKVKYEIKLLRKFVKDLSKNKTYEAPFFKGLSKIKSDWTFLKLLIHNLEVCWI